MQDTVSLLNYIDKQLELTGKREMVYNALKSLRSATSWDILNYFGESNPNSVRPRLNELEKMGLIEKVEKVKVNGILQWVYQIKK